MNHENHRQLSARSLGIVTALCLGTALATGCDKNKTPEESYVANESNASMKQEPGSYAYLEAWDLDNDGYIEYEEFTAGSSDLYTSWDGDGNGEMTDLEYTTGLYNAWDTDGDKLVDYYEYRDGVRMWYLKDVSQEDYEAYDTDNDGALSEAEFNEGFKSSTYIVSVDTDNDGMISLDELGNARRTHWDSDNDGRIETVTLRMIE